MPSLGDSEPFGSRESAVIAALRRALVDSSGLWQINSSTYEMSEDPIVLGGLAFSGAFENRLGIRAALLSLEQRSPRQAMVLKLRYGYGFTQLDIARQLQCHPNTVYNEQVRGIEALIRILWNEPEYVSSTLRFRRILRWPCPACGWLNVTDRAFEMPCQNPTCRYVRELYPKRVG